MNHVDENNSAALPPPVTAIPVLEYAAPERARAFGTGMLAIIVLAMLAGNVGKEMLRLTDQRAVLRQLAAQQVGYAQMAGSIGSLLLVPVVLWLSDITRTAWGRRRPYALSLGVLMLVSVLAMPGARRLSGSAPLMAVFISTSVLASLWQAVWAALVVDVLPLRRFALCSALAGFLNPLGLPLFFGRMPGGIWTWVLPVFGAALVALACWGMPETALCRRVLREDPVHRAWPFSTGMFVLLCVFGLLSAIATAASVFRLLYFQGTGMDLRTFGNIAATGVVVSALLVVPAAWLADRVHPVRMYLVGVLAAGLAPLTVFLVDLNNPVTYGVFAVAAALAATLMRSSELAVLAHLLPRRWFGLLYGIYRTVCSIGGILGPLLLGLLIERMGTGTPATRGGRYVYIFPWEAAWMFVSLGALVVVVLIWRRAGGDWHRRPDDGVTEVLPPPMPTVTAVSQ